MEKYKYLIIGTGMTADAAVRGIREMDPTGSVGLVGIENDLPYNRPPLTKGLWKGKALDTIWRRTEQLGARLHLGRKIVSIDTETHQVRDTQRARVVGRDQEDDRDQQDRREAGKGLLREGTQVIARGPGDGVDIDRDRHEQQADEARRGRPDREVEIVPAREGSLVHAARLSCC